MSEKVRIESNLILAFVSDLGIHAWSQFSVQAGKNPPTKKLNAKEEQEFRWTIAIVSKSIAKGFILAKHQPDLAAALVEQMNREKPGSADELLGDMLSQYKQSLAKNLADRWESPKASNQGVLKSDLTRGRNEMSEQVRIESNSILDFVRELGEYASAGIYKLDPRKKLGARDVKQLQSMADIVSLAITRGIILTNYQPELAAALVEQMNRERAGFADEQLKEMFFVYHSFLYQKARAKGWRPPGVQSNLVRRSGDERNSPTQKGSAAAVEAVEISRQLESLCRDYITALGQALDVAIRVNRKEYEAGFNEVMYVFSKGWLGVPGRNPFQFGVLKEDRPRILAEIKLLAEARGIPYNKMSPLNQFIVIIQPYVYYCLEKYLPNDAGLREEAKRLMKTSGFPRYLTQNLGYSISQTIKGAFWKPKPLGFLAGLFGFGSRH